MKLILCVLFLCAAAYGVAEEEFADSSARIAFKIYKDCTNDEGFSVCLKKKAITFLDRVARMENVSVATGINIVQKPHENCNDSAVTEAELEQTLPRALDAKEDALSYMLMDKLFKYVGSRSLEVSLPKFSAQELVEEARKGDFGFDLGGSGGKKGGGKKKGGKKKGSGMMHMMMMMMGTKMAALMGLKTILTFFIAKKALIIGKIALLLAGFMFFRNFMGKGKMGTMGHSSNGWDSAAPSVATSYGAPVTNTGGWQSGGGGGGWNAGGGYDRRSYDAQDLAYNAYSATT